MSKKQKFPLEEKVQLIRRYLKREVSVSEVSQIARVDRKTIRRWITRYQIEGAEGYLPNQRNRVYSPELKQKAVQDYLSGSASLMEISKKYKLRDVRQLSNWIKVYNNHGNFNSVKLSGGGSYMRQGRDTTQQERVQIARECISTGKNYGKMALKYQVSYQQVRAWTQRFEAMGESGLQDRRGRRKKDQKPRTELEKVQIEIEQLKWKLYLLEMENALLKNLDEVERRDAFRK